MNQTEIRQQAVAAGYAVGFSFTPLNGKKPINNAWQHAQRESCDQADSWAARGNVGLRTGDASGGLLVIDLDINKPDYDVAAVKALSLPETVTVVTGSGGYHLYFSLPAGVSLGNSAGKLAKAVDTRGNGGQVVYVGSVHPETHKPYCWMKGRELGAIAIAELPANVLALLQSAAAAAPAAGPAGPVQQPTHARGTAPAGHAVSRSYGQKALASEMAIVSQTQPGSRNQALNKAAFVMGQLVAGGEITESEVRSGLLGAAMASGLDRKESEATISSGLKDGLKDPRKAPPLAPRQHGVLHGRGTGLPPSAIGQVPATAHAPAENAGADAEPVELVYDGLGIADADSKRWIFSPSRTLPTAITYIKEFHQRPDGRTIHYYTGRLLRWKDNHYVEAEDGSIKGHIQPWLHNALMYGRKDSFEDFPANPTTVNAVLETIKAAVHVPGDVEMPAWLNADGTMPDAREVLPCRSMNLHIPSSRVLPATPKLFTSNALAFDYDEKAAFPQQWLEFLDRLWPDDPQAIELLQEWFGYCLTADTAQQKMLLMVGPKRSGKGTIGRILAELIGRDNICGPTTCSLAGPFGLQPLLGKSLAIVSDARFTGPDMQTVVERLLCVSGEDRITIDRKHQPSVTVKLPTRFVFLTNELPRLRDAAGALSGRFLILTLRNSFFGQEDTGLLSRLLAELPGILIWAINGWKALHERGRFQVPESSRDTETLLADLTSPVAAFIRELCELGQGKASTVNELYEAWCNWCQQDGRDQPGTRQTFGRDLAAAYPAVKIRRNNETGRFYEGIGLLREGPPLPATGGHAGSAAIFH